MLENITFKISGGKPQSGVVRLEQNFIWKPYLKGVVINTCPQHSGNKGAVFPSCLQHPRLLGPHSTGAALPATLGHSRTRGAQMQCDLVVMTNVTSGGSPGLWQRDCPSNTRPAGVVCGVDPGP